jgi:hypothetical protein
MKTVTYDSGGHKFNIAVPETIEEFDTLAKKQGAALEAAIDHEVYHGTLGDIRNAFVKAVATAYNTTPREIGTGVFEGEGEARAEVTNTEKPQVFLARVVAENNLTGDAPFQSIADSLSVGGANEVKFDPSVRERKAPKSPVIAKWALEQATKFLAGASDKAINKFITAAANVGVTLTRTGNTDEDVKAFAKAGMAIKAATPVFGN